MSVCRSPLSLVPTTPASLLSVWLRDHASQPAVLRRHPGAMPVPVRSESFYPGLRGGEALAQGIFGEMNAWGRLPYTIYPKNFTDAAFLAELSGISALDLKELQSSMEMLSSLAEMSGVIALDLKELQI